MKTLLALFVMTTGLSVNAKAAGLETAVMELLISKASEITLVDAETGIALEEGQQLPELLARSLMGGYLSAQKSSSVTLKDATVTCKNVTPKWLAGSADFVCRISLVDGSFKSSKGGERLEGPETESATVIEAEVSRVVYPHAKPTLKSTTLKTYIAG